MIPLGTRADDHAERRAVADQPLQSLPVRIDRRRAGARLLVRRRDQADGGRSPPTRCRPAPATNGRRSPTRRSSSATRSTWCSGWRCCWSIWCSPASMRAGSRRSAVLLAVPLSLVGPVAVLTGLRHRQQPLCPDRPDPADRAVGQERDPDRRGRARAARRGQADHRTRRSRPRAPASARS